MLLWATHLLSHCKFLLWYPAFVYHLKLFLSYPYIVVVFSFNEINFFDKKKKVQNVLAIDHQLGQYLMINIIDTIHT